jgi:thioredoxin-dependent peroxiredoxin
LRVTLLSDPDRKVLTKYGAYGEKKLYGKVSMGVIRSTVLIDPKGKIVAHWPKVKVAGHVDAVKAAVTDAQG